MILYQRKDPDGSLIYSHFVIAHLKTMEKSLGSRLRA